MGSKFHLITKTNLLNLTNMAQRKMMLSAGKTVLLKRGMNNSTKIKMIMTIKMVITVLRVLARMIVLRIKLIHSSNNIKVISLLSKRMDRVARNLMLKKKGKVAVL